MNVSKKTVCSLLEDSLIRYFLSQGFLLRKGGEDRPSSEFRVVFPFGALARKREDGGFELMEIQFDKHGKNKFILNFGICEADGITTPWGHHIMAKDISPSELPIYYVVYSSRYFCKWFSIKNENDLNRICSQVIHIGESINNWFGGGDMPKNVKRTGFA